jgi:soluble lytic murein transglycosylase
VLNILQNLKLYWVALGLLSLQFPVVAAPVLQDNPLAGADAALANGDYDAAVAAYTPAVDDPNLKCPALYGLGTTHLRADRFNESDAAFTRYLTECETSFRALILRGQVREGAGRSADALADYGQAISLNPGLLDSYLYQRMAGLDTDQSVHYLRLATEAGRYPEGKFDLRQRLANVYIAVGSPAAALTEYNTLLAEIDQYLSTLAGIAGAEFDRSGNVRADIEAVAASLEIQLGQPDAAYARLQRIITTYTETASALPALIELVTANQPVDLLTRMRINVLNENYFPVVDILTGYLNDPANAQAAPAELYLLLARAQRGQGDLQAAINTYGNLRQAFPSDPLVSVAALEQAESYAEAGDYTQAVNVFTELAASYPQSPEAPEALLSAAQTELNFGDHERALALYEQLGTSYPTSDQARRGLLGIGMLLIPTDPARAADFLGRANTAQSLVWQGKVLAGSGNPDAARIAWENAQAADPGTFFSLRGCELIAGRDSLTPLPLSPLTPISDADRAAAEAWTAQVFNLPGVSANLSPELAADPILQRGAELWAVGMWAEARGEFDALHKLRRSDPAALLQLAFYYPTIGVHRSSIYAATRLMYASNQPILSIPTAILRWAFPIYYDDLLLQLSNEKGLDPLLVAALVRQESSFDPTVVSIADARGLMQLVPTTAQDIANQLAWPNYTLDDMYRPQANLTFGTHYLSSMKAFQGNSEIGALLSYNAGPGAAQSWLAAANGDIDLLYETIEFAETQTYLDVIYTNHFLYQYLYTGGAPDCGLSTLPPVPPTPTS